MRRKEIWYRTGPQSTKQTDFLRTKLKCGYMLERLQHALELVRKLQRRNRELYEGAVRDSDGEIVEYLFVCKTCHVQFNSLYELKEHKHKPPIRQVYSSVRKVIYDSEESDIEELFSSMTFSSETAA